MSTKRPHSLTEHPSDSEVFPQRDTSSGGEELLSDTAYASRSDKEVRQERETAAREFKHLIQKYGLGRKPEIDPVYDSDTSDEETLNTIGNVPMKWYDAYDHVGYNKDGVKIAKGATQDQVDKFLSNTDNVEVWRTVIGEMGEKVSLSKQELDIISRIEKGQYADASYDPFASTVEWFTKDVQVMPLSAAPTPKRRFIPSKNEAKKIMKIARAIRKGLLIPRSPQDKKPRFYDIWRNTPEQTPNIMHISAPKMALPGNEESYNPPAEYLKTPEEIEQQQSQSDTPIFIPKKFDCLRKVPLYDRFIQERFERCLDLYLCPRMVKKKIQIDPETLIPKLPSPKDLEPFPTKLSIVYKGHAAKVSSISLDHTGFWLASASDDKTVRLWEISTGRCAKIYTFDEEPKSVQWNPNPEVSLLGIAVGNKVILVNPLLEGNELVENTDLVLQQEFTKNKNDHCTWSKPSGAQYNQGFRVIIETTRLVTSLSWHRKGDYFVTVASTSSNSSSLVHQISKWQSQNPFQKTKGIITSVMFHPSKPFLFLATQRIVRIYNLLNQQLIKKLISGVKWISSMDIHPQGDNLIIGSFDKRLSWFDMDLSCKPYKTLRYHSFAVRDVAYHQKQPLFASCSDDGNVNIFHGMVYNDLMMNPLIVPLIKLNAHQVTGGVGVTSVMFHPNQPWIVSSGADGTILVGIESITREHLKQSPVIHWTLRNYAREGDTLVLVHGTKHLDANTAKSAGYTEGASHPIDPLLSVGADIPELERNVAVTMLNEKRMDILSQYKGNIAGLQVKVNICKGDPRDILVKAAETNSADVVIIGNRGIGTVKR